VRFYFKPPGFGSDKPAIAVDLVIHYRSTTLSTDASNGVVESANL